MIYTYQTEQYLNTDIEKAWNFFSSPENLAQITPPEIGFKVLTKLDGIEIHEGMLIDYIIKPLLRIPLRWQTEICNVKKPFLFTDKQLKGPYSLWEHTHTFIEKDRGVLMKDELNYKLPFGFIGDITHQLIVKNKIGKIFKFRREMLTMIFK